jgi:hypothetical protein
MVRVAFRSLSAILGIRDCMGDTYEREHVDYYLCGGWDRHRVPDVVVVYKV